MRIPSIKTLKPFVMEQWAEPSGAAGRGKGHVKRGTAKKGISFSALANNPGRFGFSQNGIGDSPEAEGDGGISNGEAGSGFGKNARLSGVFQRLFEQIDQGLDYPEELFEHGVEGTVRADLAFTGEGEWKASASRVRSDSDFLRVYIRRLLPKLLRSSLHTKFTGGYTVPTEFIFEIKTRIPVNHGLQQQMLVNAAGKNITGRAKGAALVFMRTHSKWLPISFIQMEENQRDLDGSPTKKRTGIAIDMSVLEDGISAISRLVSPKAQLDPLERYRQDPVFRESD